MNNHHHEHLLDYTESNESKWFAFADKSWIIFDFDEVQSIYGIGVKSANDDWGRDPHTVTVSVPDGDDDWREVGHFDLPWSERYEILQFAFEREETSSVRLDFENPDPSFSGHPEMQLGQVLFYTALE